VQEVIEIHFIRNIQVVIQVSKTSLAFTAGTVYTVTVGAGWCWFFKVHHQRFSKEFDSSISGSGITTITSTGR
jgi:hypothetical protein